MTISNRPNAEAIYIVDACRTPTGRIGGQLAHVRLDDLAAHAIRSLLRRQPAVPGSAIADVVWGAANQAGEDNRNVGRMAALLAGLPATTTGVTARPKVLEGVRGSVE